MQETSRSVDILGTEFKYGGGDEIQLFGKNIYPWIYFRWGGALSGPAEPQKSKFVILTHLHI